MNKKLLFSLFSVFFALKNYSQSYTQSFTTTGNVLNTNMSAQVCPVSGQNVTFKANAAWPFGSDGNLIIGAGQTIQIPCGVIKDYDSINIAAGGTLEIMDGTGWTIIGCRRGFVLNGIILAKNGTHAGGTFSMNEPDENGSLNGNPVSYTITQKSGGDGGYGGRFTDGSYSGYSQGGFSFFGNGGGGGGGGSSGPSTGGNGGNGLLNSSGVGGLTGGGDGPTPAVTQYGQNGQQVNYYNNWGGSPGASGGFRGKHGGLLYIYANNSIGGTGTIDVSGSKGGDGANVAYTGACLGGYGGASGGGAGGSGGYVYVKYKNSAPTVSVLSNGGNKGLGGVNVCWPCSAGNCGNNGQDGQDGNLGTFLFQPETGSYQYQWRRNSTNIPGAISYKHTDNIAGTYDCKITKPDLSVVYTSGSFGLDRDTIFVDATPIAQIISVSPGNGQICFGDTAILTAQNILGQSYQWVLNGVPIIGENNTTLLATQAGNYLVAANNTCNAPEVSSQVSIIVNNLPTAPLISFSPNDTICEGNSVTLQSSVSNNIQWNTGSTNSAINVNQTGNYFVTITDMNLCSNTSDTIHIEVLPASVNLGFDDTLTCGFTYQFNPIINPSSINSYNWTPNNGFSCTNCPNPIVSPGQGTTNYNLLVNFLNGCSSSDDINITTATGADIPICVVTTDSATGTYNVIVWEKPANDDQLDSFRIYREITTNNYQQIGAVHKDSLSVYEDHSVNTNTTNYKYKISAVDTCGNESDLSLYHNTIKLIYISAGQFQWTLYEIENTANPVASYNFYRDDIGNGNFQIVSIIPGGNSNYTDVNYLSFPNSRYRVDVVWQNSNICSPSRAGINTSRSNIKNSPAAPTGINNRDLNTVSVYPNPTNDLITINYGQVTEAVELKLFDAIGKQIFSRSDKPTTINLSEYERGIYFLQFDSLSGVKNIKLIIE